MAYTTINKPEDHFNIVTYTGNNTNNRSITGLGFQPDLTWIKMRQSQLSDHALFDSSRGTNKKLASNTTAAEVSPSQYGGVGSFDSDGFTLVNGTTQVLSSYMFEVNKTSSTYVAWNWKANGGTTSSNTDGTLTSTVQANTDAGFSIVTFTGNSASDQTVGHGLGTSPDLILLKCIDTTTEWVTYHSILGSNKFLYLNLTTAESTVSSYWGTPSSTTFGVKGGGWANNVNGLEHIAYCFAEKQGFSKFGKYVGNGEANGTFVYTGFKPAWVMFKESSAADNWVIIDSKRDTYNAADATLYADLNNSEENPAASVTGVDLLSNGFKFRDLKGFWNTSGSTYIYMAFAENPFVTSTGIPTTAR